MECSFKIVFISLTRRGIFWFILPIWLHCSFMPLHPEWHVLWIKHYLLILLVCCVSDDDDDDEDDEAALILELEQIRKERAEEKLRKVRVTLSRDYSTLNWYPNLVLLIGANELAIYNMFVRILYVGQPKQ